MGQYSSCKNCHKTSLQICVKQCWLSLCFFTPMEIKQWFAAIILTTQRSFWHSTYAGHDNNLQKQMESGAWAVRLPQTWQKQPNPAALCGTKTIARKRNKDIINVKNRDSSRTLRVQIWILHRSAQNSTQILGAPRRKCRCCSCGTPWFRCAASRLPRQRGHRLGELELITQRWRTWKPGFGAQKSRDQPQLSTWSDLSNDCVLDI